MRVNPVGTVEVLTGSHSHGQGHETTFAQLVSDRLGIDINNVAIVHGDTDKVQFGMGTYGSRSGAVGMTAISKALDKIEAKAKKVAAARDGSGRRRHRVQERHLHGQGHRQEDGLRRSGAGGLCGTQVPDVAKSSRASRKASFHDPSNFTFPAGVPYLRGRDRSRYRRRHQIANWTAVDDFGTIINPMIVEGQVHGGIAQGIGQALTEGCVYDTRSGQLLTGSYMDYCMPRAARRADRFKLGFTETKCPSNPLGMKGCGEAGAIAAPAAVMNAVTDALGGQGRADAGNAAQRMECDATP